MHSYFFGCVCVCLSACLWYWGLNPEPPTYWANVLPLSYISNPAHSSLFQADLHKREKELSLEKEQNKRLWDRDTGNSITIDHLRRELDDRNMEVQRLEALLKAMKSECQGQMERQVRAFRLCPTRWSLLGEECILCLLVQFSSFINGPKIALK